MRASKQASNQLVNGRGEKKTPLSSSLALLEKMFFFFIFVCLLSPFFESQNAHGGGEIQTPLSLSLSLSSLDARAFTLLLRLGRTNERSPRLLHTEKRSSSSSSSLWDSISLRRKKHDLSSAKQLVLPSCRRI
jgi:hypothetical protein